ncbi:MAG: phosphate acyltransferase [Solirubrobacteraceae bacterium]|nr:phosphate acyltransferase [Solirubrobacteraceae bacterium]
MESAARPRTRGVAVDASGADLGPAEVAAGARLAAAQGVRVLLFGPAAELGAGGGGVEIVDAPVSIAKQRDPVRAVRSTPDASIVRAARAVAAGEAEALVCGGSTGAALAACLFHVKRARGIHRPALAVPVPVPGHPVTLLDVGANAEARREHLVQFAYMGAAFASGVLGIARPRVGLLSNGAEDGRGSQLLIDVHALLAERAGSGAGGGLDGGVLEFVGNVEGDGLVQGAADVVVTDGLTGNIALKLIEGVSQAVLGAVRDVAASSRRGRLGGLLLRPSLRGFRAEIDPEGQGGAYLLGLRRLVVVTHGRFGRAGVAQAILRAAAGVEEDVVGRTHAALEAAGALRRSAAPGTSADGATVPGHDD